MTLTSFLQIAHLTFFQSGLCELHNEHCFSFSSSFFQFFFFLNHTKYKYFLVIKSFQMIKKQITPIIPTQFYTPFRKLHW